MIDNMLQIVSKMDNLYKLYGYDVKDFGGIHVYEYKHGRYYGADIYNISASKSKLQEIQSMYQQQSFAASIRSLSTFESIENELFASFFHVDSFKSILKCQYKQYTKKIEEHLANKCKYSYISGKYRELFFEMRNNVTWCTERVSNKSVIKEITSSMYEYEEKPLLTIIEAAAGYGKTCAAYEIVNELSISNRLIIPLYIELARNREARIFKHILLNEIEKQFQNVVTSDVVLYQIKQGKIPIIIDGFDELLSKDFETDVTNLRDVESMLSTILDLLEGRAKVIITSRKTAIFTGDKFYQCVSRSDRDFLLQRISLEAPEVNDWLTADQKEVLKHCEDFEWTNVANPVVLSYVRSLSLPEFRAILDRKVNVVALYFKSMLDRERNRQDLFMDEETQKRILRKLVRMMCEFDIKCETKSFIKELILDYNEDIFSKYIKDYPKSPKPTHEDLAETFSNHALLDRNKDNQVGFINDFVFALLIGENIILNKYKEHYPNNYREVLPQAFAIQAVEAYRIMPQDERNMLWKTLEEADYPFDDSFAFAKDIYLTSTLHKSVYQNFVVEDVVIRNVMFTGKSQLENVIFSNVVFKNCVVKRSCFKDSGFIDCSFYDCSWEEEEERSKTVPYMLGVKSCNNDFENRLYYESTTIESVELSQTKQIEHKILSLFIRAEGRVIGMRRVQLIRNECSDFPERNITKVMNLLKNNGYIILNGGNCFIQQEGITYYNKVYSKKIQ